LQFKGITNAVLVVRWAFPMATAVAGAKAGALPINFLNIVTVGAIQELADGAADVFGGLILCRRDHIRNNDSRDRGEEGCSTS